MKTVLIIFAILAVMVGVIMIPAIEEAEYAKTHPDFLKNAYDLRNTHLDKPVDTIKEREN